MTDKLKGYSTTAASNNSDAPDGWPEGMLPSEVNNSGREMMARLAEWYQDAAWISLAETIQSSTSSSIVISGDKTATYLAGRPIRVNQSGSQVGYIASSSYSAPNTTINVTGFTVSSPTIVEVGIIPSTALLPNTITLASASVTGTFTAGAVSFSSANVAGTISAAQAVISGTLTAAAYVGTITSGNLATDSGMMTWVLARAAAASVGDVGTYAMLARSSTNQDIDVGTTYAGSGLRYAGIAGSGVSVSGTAPSGTWRAMGDAQAGVGEYAMTLFLRVS